MGVNFEILQGFGYVIPKNSIPKDIYDKLYDVIESTDFIFNYSEQGCYGDTDDSQIFIYMEKDINVLVNKKISYNGKDNFNYGCNDFAVITYNPECDTDDKYYEKRPIFLNKKKKQLDNMLKNLPIIYQIIKNNYNERYENWIFGLLG